MNFEAVLVSLHAIALGDEFGLSRQNVRPARRGFPKKRIDAKRPRAFVRKFAVHRRRMAAEKSPRGVGREMNNGFASPFCTDVRCERSGNRASSARPSADRSAQVGGSERRDGMIAGDQKCFGLCAG